MSCESEPVITSEILTESNENLIVNPIDQDSNVSDHGLDSEQNNLVVTQNLPLNSGLENSPSKSSCTLVNANRFTAETWTYGLPLGGGMGYKNFRTELKKNVLNELRDYYSLSQARPSSTTFIESGSVEGISGPITFDVAGVDPNVNLSPRIVASDANLVYQYSACHVIDHIDSLPALSGTDQYVVVITYVWTDHPGNPVASQTYLTVLYDIEKWTF